MQPQNNVHWNTDEVFDFVPSSLRYLEPIGVGTPYVESLTSFVKRLAQMHHVKVVDLVSFCSEQTQADVMTSTISKLSRIDGITQSAQNWSTLLQRLTHCREAQYLTMTYWQPILNPYQMLRQHHAWCPLCYADWLEADKPPYEMLLWRLRLVECCPIHHYKLMEHCPSCGQRFTTMTNSATVGFCPKCHTWLGEITNEGIPVVPNSESDLLAQTLGQFLSLTPQVPQPNRHIVPAVIQAVKRNKDIPYTHLYRTLQVGSSFLQAVKAGERLPNLAFLGQLAIVSEGNLWSALCGDEMPIQLNYTLDDFLRLKTSVQQQAYLEDLLASPNPVPLLSKIAETCGFKSPATFGKAFPVQYAAFQKRLHQEQKQALQAVLDGDVIMTVTDLARKRGYHHAVLYRCFPELCHQVTRVFHERKLAHCRQYLQRIIEGDDFPCATAIRKSLGVGIRYLAEHFSDEMNLIEAKRQQKLQQEEYAIQHSLDEVLASRRLPPISLNEIAVALHKSTKYLKTAFPVQTEAILERRHSYYADLLQATCHRIQQIVFELHRQGIYPSVDRIHAAIGTWMIHGKAHRHAYIEAMDSCGYSDTRI